MTNLEADFVFIIYYLYFIFSVENIDISGLNKIILRPVTCCIWLDLLKGRLHQRDLKVTPSLVKKKIKWNTW